ncbi:MAG: SpoIIE family protein phosphatase [bacterium]|nr:SpoIIE family protein phosphatase [bacterium]
MKVKYKIILILIFVILAVSLSISLFILEQEQTEKIELLKNQAKINSKILAGLTSNIYLMSGGNIRAARVDSKEMLLEMKPLMKEGLISADVVLLSSKEKYNGLTLAAITDMDTEGMPRFDSEKLEKEEAERLRQHPGFFIRTIPAIEGAVYEFVARKGLPQSSTQCSGRLLFSEQRILAPLKVLRLKIFVAIFAAVVIVGLLGLLLSLFISKPIDRLTSGVKRIGDGDFDYQLPVKSRDEIGKLAQTFNHLVQVVKLEMGELESANKDLKRLDRIKDDFLANMSHELRTPLYGIIGLAESLSNGAAGKLNKEVVDNLSLMTASGKRLSHLVNDILDISQLRHRDIILQRTTVDLHSLTQVVISIVQPLAVNKSLKVENRVAPGEIYVNGDESRLQQIVLNLVDNAIKFTEQGTVTVYTEKLPRKNQVLFNVADTGIGIALENHEKIFGLFEQADGSISRSHGGTGLGLAISKKLVELHGGEIWVESEPGIGSRFSFAIEEAAPPAPEALEENNQQTAPIMEESPWDAGEAAAAVEDEAAGDYELPDELQVYSHDIPEISEIPGNITPGVSIFSSETSSKAPHETEAKKILLVDDEPVNIRVLENHLGLKGYKTITANSAGEALEYLEENELPDLVILDVMLPRMSGYDVCRLIRERHSRHELPVLMLTAKNKPGDIVTGLGAGANDYLTKPVDSRELLARVGGLISLKRSVQVHDELNILKRDLQIAHEIQQSLLSEDVPGSDLYEISVLYRPMYELGGDFYDIRVFDDTTIGLLIADVSGHGIPAALISSMLKIAHSFHRDDARDPALLLKKINQTMHDFTHDQFITSCYAYIDLAAMKMIQANAGHCPIVICGRNGEQRLLNEANGMPIGWVPDESYTNIDCGLAAGDRVVFYTDGIVEARNPENKQYGDKRFYGNIKDLRHRTSREFTDDIFDSINEWVETSESQGLDDDATIIVLDVAD